jgi:hypothetical protein
MAKPLAQIDWDKVQYLFEAGCTTKAVARAIGVSHDTIRRRCKRDMRLDFHEFFRRCRARGDNLLRAKQYEIALKGNVTMLIWLGKQRLGQSDRTELSGPGGGPTMITVRAVPMRDAVRPVLAPPKDDDGNSNSD